jgi:hypothetical protein
LSKRIISAVLVAGLALEEYGGSAGNRVPDGTFVAAASQGEGLSYLYVNNARENLPAFR